MDRVYFFIQNDVYGSFVICAHRILKLLNNAKILMGKDNFLVFGIESGGEIYNISATLVDLHRSKSIFYFSLKKNESHLFGA